MEKKRVGIITICKCNNYGAELQAYATVEKLRQMGYEAEIIDYLYYKSWRFRDSRVSRPFVPMNIKGRISYWVKYRLAGLMMETVAPCFLPSMRRRIKRFADFHQANTPFSKQYLSMDDLYRDLPLYDIYMTGSDQVWNPSASSSIEPYFLSFAPQGAKRVSYAASFGVNQIDEELQPRYAKLLSTYDRIGVREADGCNLVKQLCGKEATWVLDPTLLLGKNNWMKVSGKYPQVPQHYVLIYQLSDSRSIAELAKRIGHEKKIPILRIAKRACFVKKDNGVHNLLDVGPSEFLSLIAGADYVLTNSFHGTAFSINMGVPFWTIVSTKKANNSRIESLLGMLGLKERMLLDDCKIDEVDVNASVHYEDVLKKLAVERHKSELFLREAL